MQKTFKIFISYRRKGGYDTAKLLYDRLRLDGYSVFFDIDALENGNFDNELERKVKKCKDFLLVLNSGIFERFREPGYNAKDDWVRQEIICALQSNKNIIPLVLDGFVFPKRLPDDIKDLNRKNSIDLNPIHFDAVYEKMKDSFLLSKPCLRVRLKKQIRFFMSVLFLAFLSLVFYVFMVHTQAKEAKIIADSVILAKDAEVAILKDSLRVAKENEMAIVRDSTRISKNVEVAMLKDSMIDAKDAEIEVLRDSIAMYRRWLQNSRQTANTTTTKKTTAATIPKKTTTAKKTK
ncbi:MAG: toll/interleukin-1 receptor domain-containing protein [Fibromonadales bacterium]|nr:toll/interleukin-1 receptor domain-containing protein [Fibromonadales bacterium]